MSNLQLTTWDWDDVLTEVGAGRYQTVNFILIGLVLLFSDVSPLSFTLTAADLNYRCTVPICENSSNAVYTPDWLKNAVPFDRYNEPKKCLRYRLVNGSNENTGRSTDRDNKCDTSLFSTETEKCQRWIFENNEMTIAREFQIMCEDRKWQLTLVGTINTIGQYIGICFFGIISDKYGRKFTGLLCTIVSTLFGLLRAFSTSYTMFVVLEFLDSLFSSGIYGSLFVLGIELVTSKFRPMVTIGMGTFYPFGAVIMGFVAWQIQDWRKLILICYTPALLFISYYWLIPESIRWLETNGRHDEVVEIIKNMSKVNRRPLSEATLESIKYPIKQHGKKINVNQWTAFKSALKCRYILLRLLNSSFCWVAITMVYYGLIINSVELVGNKYLNFILVNLVEVPSFIASGIITAKFPRKPSQIITFVISGLACVVFSLVPSGYVYIQLGLFLISKFMITTSFVTFYTYSTEMFPTKLRLSLFGLSSTIGRIGTIIAPQTVLLEQYLGKNAPVLLFGTVSLIAGLLSTFFPETYQQELPDTLDEINNLTKN